jgi:hypothetical protein
MRKFGCTLLGARNPWYLFAFALPVSIKVWHQDIRPFQHVRGRADCDSGMSMRSEGYNVSKQYISIAASTYVILQTKYPLNG